jgi:hypothetical protein
MGADKGGRQMGRWKASLSDQLRQRTDPSSLARFGGTSRSKAWGAVIVR